MDAKLYTIRLTKHDLLTVLDCLRWVERDFRFYETPREQKRADKIKDVIATICIQTEETE